MGARSDRAPIYICKLTTPKDTQGNVTSRNLRGYAADSTQHIDYAYDHLERLTTKTLPNSEPAVSYGYDLLGRLTSAPTLTFGY
jgi:YD repeat-containing protein